MDDLNIQDLLREIEDLLYFTLRKIDLDNSDFAKNIKITWDGVRVNVSMPEYGEFIDKGRKKGRKAPPVSAMIEYIREKNMRSTDLTEEQLAYAIANSIKRDGIKPRPFIEKLTEETFNLVSQHIFMEINKKLSKIFKR